MSASSFPNPSGELHYAEGVTGEDPCQGKGMATPGTGERQNMRRSSDSVPNQPLAPLERPILFTGPMVRAILAGKKHQTRRIAKEQPKELPGLYGDRYNHTRQWTYWLPDNRMDKARTFRCPYGDVGDRLWVRETWAVDASLDEVKPSDLSPEIDLEHVADGSRTVGRESYERGRLRPSIFMPRWASRLTLQVTEVRLERVQEISEYDAQAEGIVSVPIPADEYAPERIGWMVFPDDGVSTLSASPRDVYERLWDSINGDRAPWSSDPFVWALTFEISP